MYSNCLFQAIIAKIKDPKGVTIHYLPGKINPRGHAHFYWYRAMPNNPLIEDGTGAVMEDFARLEKGWQRVWFRGWSRQQDVSQWEDFVRKTLKHKGYTDEQIKKYEKRHGFLTAA